ncbi:hypothetical protein [Roseateles violae]|uniref:Cyclic nucleotide-binding domain-containing protein n=1 Tax=Roseateles violae TaxID=3058042 RepID=A0ABT8DWV8_9BURK|nr:hypothetical protein [Pelomonas sp. PFR6]MDN3920776.1 hypothetical protein [Pelomonas sp. PFR6]
MKTLADAVQPREVQGGEQVFGAGGPADSTIFVIGGRLRATRRGRRADRRRRLGAAALAGAAVRRYP